MNPFDRTELDKIFRRWLGQPPEKAMKALEQNKMMQQLRCDVEAAMIAARAELLAKRDELPAKHEKAIKATGLERERALQALHAAQANLASAIAAHNDTSCRLYGLQHAYDSERSELTRQLEESADPRIQQFVDALAATFDIARNIDAVARLIDRGNGVATVEYDNTALRLGCSAIREAQEKARSLKMLAISSAEVTERLDQIARDLAKPLQQLAATSGDPSTLRPPKVETPDGATLH